MAGTSRPDYTSDPGSLITAHAIQTLGLEPIPAAWLIQTSNPLTAAQVNTVQKAAAGAGVYYETRTAQQSSAPLRNWSTAAGIILALGVLGMTVGLIRSETANDLRTLAAAGASSTTRRTLTGATGGALGLLASRYRQATPRVGEGDARTVVPQSGWFDRGDLIGQGGQGFDELLVVLPSWVCGDGHYEVAAECVPSEGVAVKECYRHTERPRLPWRIEDQLPVAARRRDRAVCVDRDHRRETPIIASRVITSARTSSVKASVPAGR